MSRELVGVRTPEEIELEAKLSELSQVETELAQGELNLATLLGELQAFEREYMRIVGVRYAELDRIEAEIAEELARRLPNDRATRERAFYARERANETARTAGEAREPHAKGRFSPSERLKKLYREAAKRIHPDLATDEEECARRTRIMQQVNDAYAAGDEDRLESILREWETSPEAVKGDDIGSTLIRTIRKISQGRNRIGAIQTELDKLKASALYRLKAKADEAMKAGRDLMSEMAGHIDSQIAAARMRLVELQGHGAKP